VLIFGESGCGKELVARQIHQRGKRSGKPFVAINCAAIPENLIESELFGFRKGSFTGAERNKPGLFEIADGGTLFLDEINNAPMALQAKLLRVLQDGSFYPTGATEPVHVDVRVIAASNRQIPELVEAGQFREDLFYRLSVMEISVPPLRERREDIALLTYYLLNKHTLRLGKHIGGISTAVLGALMRYDWPGNVRELENIVQRMIILAESDQIDTAVLPSRLTDRRTRAAAPSTICRRKAWTRWKPISSARPCARRTATAPWQRKSSASTNRPCGARSSAMASRSRAVKDFPRHVRPRDVCGSRPAACAPSCGFRVECDVA